MVLKLIPYHLWKADMTTLYGTKSTLAVLTIRIRSSSRFLRTVANSCKDLAGKEKVP